MVKLIKIGKFGRPHGVDGTLRHFVFGSGDSIKIGTRVFVKSNISDELETYEIEKIKGKDKSLIKLKELDSPEKSRGLVNKDTYLKRSSFRQLNESEFYLADLIGVEVFDFHDQALGCVEKYYNNGGHEVCCLNTNLEFPLIKKFIKEINLKEKVMSLTLTKEFFDELS